MSKKVFLQIIAIVTFIVIALGSADPAFQEGFREGWNSTAPPEYRY